MTKIHPSWVPNATEVLPVNLQNGGSKPRVCKFDDKVSQLVKWHPSIHGLTATYSELVASRLGQLINAPVIRGAIVRVAKDLLPPGIDQMVDQEFHIGFTYVNGKNFTFQDYPGLANGGSLPSAAVLLAWLHMGDHDHHSKNKFMRQFQSEDNEGETINIKEFVLIDLSAIYGLDDWNSCLFGSPEKEYVLPQHFCERINLDDASAVVQQVVGLEEEEIISCLDFYPDEWRINAEAVKRLAGFLLDRRRHLNDIVCKNLRMRLQG